MEWRRFGRCETCNQDAAVVVFKPTDFELPPSGSWVCGACDPAEHEDYARGLVELADELGHKPN